MAIRVIFHLMDDLDGTVSPDVDRIVFGLDGTTYEIDLTAANAAQLRSSLAEFMTAARPVGPSPIPQPRLPHIERAAATDGTEAAALVGRTRTAPDWQFQEQQSA